MRDKNAALMPDCPHSGLVAGSSVAESACDYEYLSDQYLLESYHV